MLSGHPFSPTHVARIALAGAAIGLGALAAAVPANAQPVPPLPTPVPGQPPPPGQPVMEAPGSEPIAAPAPPPIGAPVVPEISNPRYGQGSRPRAVRLPADAWHQAQDPYRFTGTPPGQMPAAATAPAEPVRHRNCRPDTNRLTDPASNEAAAAEPPHGRDRLCPRYYPLTGPPASRVLRRAAPARPPRATAARAARRLAAPDLPNLSAGMTSRSNSSMPDRS